MHGNEAAPYNRDYNNGEIVPGILEPFRRTKLQLEMPEETLRLIEAAAVVSGCSVKQFIIRAAETHAREIIAGQNTVKAARS